MDNKGPWDAAFDKLVRCLLDFEGLEGDELGEVRNEHQLSISPVLLALRSGTFIGGNKLVLYVRVNRLVDLVPTEIASVGGDGNHRLYVGSLDNDSLALHKGTYELGVESSNRVNFSLSARSEHDMDIPK